jgi:hypothetical protein
MSEGAVKMIDVRYGLACRFIRDRLRFKKVQNPTSYKAYRTSNDYDYVFRI